MAEDQNHQIIADSRRWIQESTTIIINTINTPVALIIFPPLGPGVERQYEERNDGEQVMNMPLWYLSQMSPVWAKSLRVQMTDHQRKLWMLANPGKEAHEMPQLPEFTISMLSDMSFELTFDADHGEYRGVVVFAMAILTYLTSQVTNFTSSKPGVSPGWLDDDVTTELVFFVLGFFHRYHCPDGIRFVTALIIDELNHNQDRLDRRPLPLGTIGYILERFPTNGLFYNDNDKEHQSLCIAVLRELYIIMDQLYDNNRLQRHRYDINSLKAFIRLRDEVARIPNDSLYDILVRVSSNPDLEFWHWGLWNMRNRTFPPLDDFANASDIDFTDTNEVANLIQNLNAFNMPEPSATAAQPQSPDEAGELYQQSMKSCFTKIAKAIIEQGPLTHIADRDNDWGGHDDYPWEPPEIFKVKDHMDPLALSKYEHASHVLKRDILPKMNALAKTLLLGRLWTSVPRCYFPKHTLREGFDRKNTFNSKYLVDDDPYDYARQHQMDGNHWLWLRNDGNDDFRHGGWGGDRIDYPDTHWNHRNHPIWG